MSGTIPDHFDVEQRALEYAPKPTIDKYVAAFVGFSAVVCAITLFCGAANISYDDHWIASVCVAAIAAAIGFFTGKSQEDRYWRAYERARRELELDM